jgi:hypothetical protein
LSFSQDAQRRLLLLRKLAWCLRRIPASPVYLSGLRASTSMDLVHRCASRWQYVFDPPAVRGFLKLAGALVWPARAFELAVKCAIEVGRQVRAMTGKSIGRQICE